jgi:hypothetical protein
MLREAKRPSSHRLAYFQTIYKLEMIDEPYSFHRNENKDVIAKAKEAAYLHFSKWKGECKEEYLQAEKEYDEIKAEKPRGPYMKEALALNVSPIFHNIIAYHLTGVGFYRAQVKQNLSAVMQHLGRRKLFSLRDYILMLIHDMENGPAAFVGDAKRLRIME